MECVEVLTPTRGFGIRLFLDGFVNGAVPINTNSRSRFIYIPTSNVLASCKSVAEKTFCPFSINTCKSQNQNVTFSMSTVGSGRFQRFFPYVFGFIIFAFFLLRLHNFTLDCAFIPSSTFLHNKIR